MQLWMSTTSFLETASGDNVSAGFQIHHATNYILQMIIAAGFSLLKLLNSFFANHVDLDYGKKLFRRAIWMIRTISISANDLPSRLAEVLAQLWNSGGAGSRIPKRSNEVVDSSLQLKVRCRMSMSLVYDSVWRWREEFQAKGKGNLECKLSSFIVSLTTGRVYLITISCCEQSYESELGGGEHGILNHCGAYLCSTGHVKRRECLRREYQRGLRSSFVDT